jgi:hypothetical protein
MNIDLILRAIKGAPLTFNEVDNNFDLLKAAIITTLQNSAGATAPPNPVAHQLWLDTSVNTANVLNIRNAANTAWIVIGRLNNSTSRFLLSAQEGGTGRNTLTNNSVLIGNNTGAVKLVAPSTAGNVLTSDAGEWKSLPAVAANIVYQA